MTRFDWFWRHPVWTLIGVGLAVRILPVTVRFVIGSDDGLFLTLGRNLAAGQGYTGDGLTTQVDFPPGYPFFAAFIYWLGGGLEWPTRLNVLLVGMLLPVVIFWLARQLIDRKTALLAGILTSLHPALVLAQGNFESVAEQPYALLLYGGWAVLWWGLTRRRLLAFGAAGLLLGAAHLVRWEGVILGLAAAVIIVITLRRRAVGPVFIFLVGLALFVIPYGVFLHRHTGSFLSPKTMLTQLHAAAIDATAEDPYAFERSFYEHYEVWLADPTQPPQLLHQGNRLAFLPRYFQNVLRQIDLWFTSVSFMTVLWIGPFFIGLWALWWRRTLFLLPLFVPLAAIPASVVDPRYFLIPLPIMMIFAAAGWSWLAERLPEVRLPGWPRPVSLTPVLVAVTLILFLLADLSGPFLYPRPTGYRQAGLVLRREIPPGAPIMARKRQVPFYAGGVWVWLPFAPLEEVVAYAQARNVAYLVLDRFTTPTLRPQLSYLLDPANAPPELRPVYADEVEGVIIYRLVGHP